MTSVNWTFLLSSFLWMAMLPLSFPGSLWLFGAWNIQSHCWWQWRRRMGGQWAPAAKANCDGDKPLENTHQTAERSKENILSCDHQAPFGVTSVPGGLVAAGTPRGPPSWWHPFAWYLPAWKRLHVALSAAGSLVYWGLALLRSVWTASAWYENKMLPWSPDKFLLGRGISSLEIPVLTFPSAWAFISSARLGEATGMKKPGHFVQSRTGLLISKKKWTYKTHITLQYIK